MGRRLSRCDHCRAPVVWFRSPFTGKARLFEAKPVDPRTHQGRPAFPVENGRAWKPYELAADLRVRRECSTADAEAEVRDMPWHLFHECPNAPYSAPTEESTTR